MMPDPAPREALRMRATPIPTNEVWPGAVRRVIGPPGGDLTNPEIAPVEVLTYAHVLGGVAMPVHAVRCALDPGDLEQLAAGGTIWLSFVGHMVPFDVTVRPPVEPGQEP